MSLLRLPARPSRPEALAPFACASAGHGPSAAADAVSEAVARLASDPSLILLFPDGCLDAGEALSAARTAAPSAQIAGLTASGVVGSAGPLEAGCSAMAFGSGAAVGVGVAEKASRNARTAGRDAATEALRFVDRRAGHALLMLFLDTCSGDQSDVIAGAYEVAGPELPLVGGAAGGSNPRQLAGDLAARDLVIAVALVSPRPVGVGIADGCSPIATPGIVTRASGRVVERIDGRPAALVYLEKVGHGGRELSEDEFEQVATVHPLGQPELRGDVRLRHVLGRTAEGGIECATPMTPGAAVEFRRQTPEAIVRSTFHAVSDALRPLGGPARAALVFDCAGRRSALGGPGETLEAEVSALVSSFGQPAPEIAGLYTRGEVGRVRGAKGDRNHAVVVATFA